MDLIKHKNVYRIIKKLNPNYKQGIKYVLALYKAIDISINKFKKITLLKCPQNCGQCCESVDVETTYLEFLPLSVYLWAKKKAVFWLDKINNSEDSKVCVFYSKEVPANSKSHCMIYPLRPSVCRLFGFCSISDKNNLKSFFTCKIMKDKYPKECAQAQDLVKNGFSLPKINDFSIRLLNASPCIESKLMPINIAARTALEKIGFNLDLGVSVKKLVKVK